MSVRVRVLFVCLGNICRSPVAEGVLRHELRERGLDHLVEVSSAGLGGWHAGERPDRRSIDVAARNGVTLESRARVVNPEEFESTHWIICMDHQNRRGLEKLGAPGERVRLLKSFAKPPPTKRPAEREPPRRPYESPGAQPGDEVDDPYEHGPEAFDRMYAEIREHMEHFIEHLVAEHRLQDAARLPPSTPPKRAKP